MPQAERDLSVAEPRAIGWSPSGRRAFVAGLGSNNVVAFDPGSNEVPRVTIEVGEGPTGLSVSSSGDRLYVLGNRTEDGSQDLTDPGLVWITLWDSTEDCEEFVTAIERHRARSRTNLH